MNRLTFVDEDGHVLFDNPAGFPEDIGFTIRELAENEEWGTLDNIAEKLANCEERLKHYEDLEEQGKLLKLPCVVGDTLYCDGKYFASHCEGEIHSFKVSDIVTEIRSYFRGEVDYCFDFEAVGKTVFLTREEAEAALKEL